MWQNQKWKKGRVIALKNRNIIKLTLGGENVN